MSAADLDSDGNISKEKGWEFMTEKVFGEIEKKTPEEIDQLVFSIEEFIETKLCTPDERSAKEAEWQAKRQAERQAKEAEWQAKEAERQAKRQAQEAERQAERQAKEAEWQAE